MNSEKVTSYALKNSSSERNVTTRAAQNSHTSGAFFATAWKGRIQVGQPKQDRTVCGVTACAKVSST